MQECNFSCHYPIAVVFNCRIQDYKSKNIISRKYRGLVLSNSYSLLRETPYMHWGGVLDIIRLRKERKQGLGLCLALFKGCSIIRSRPEIIIKEETVPFFERKGQFPDLVNY
jgi:hypothetical protein